MAPVLVLVDFHSEEVYQKKLIESDMKERSRLYIMQSAAHRICYDIVARSFDDAILHHLKALNPPASAPIDLSWLSLAINFLSFVHTEARTLLSNLHLSPDSNDSLAGYLDGTLKLLDLCNSITSLIERLCLYCLSINFVLQLLAPFDSGFPALEKLRRARDSLFDWEKHSVSLEKWGFQSSPEDLIKDLAAGLGGAPRGKISSADKLLCHIIHALGLLMVFFAGVLISALYGLPKMAVVRVSTKFSWADSFNTLEYAVLTKLTQRFLVKKLDDMGTFQIARCSKVFELKDLNQRENFENFWNDLYIQ